MGLEFIDVVRFRNHLDSIDVAKGHSESTAWALAMSKMVSDAGIALGGHDKRMSLQSQRVLQSVSALVSHIDLIKRDLDRWIQRNESEFLEISATTLYTQFQNTMPGRILERPLDADKESADLFHERVKLHTNWRVPGMIIRPALETHIQDMVAMDPLYVVDHAWHLIEPAMSSFNDQYRARLRPYTVLDTQSSIMHSLPQRVFGLILAYNFFNYKPLNVIDRWLQESWNLLADGGVMIMTFNDCDRAHGVGLVGSAMGCYTPGSHLRRLATAVGFEIINQHHSQSDLVWIELRRPGMIRSIRGAQTLAKIVERSK